MLVPLREPSRRLRSPVRNERETGVVVTGDPVDILLIIDPIEFLPFLVFRGALPLDETAPSSGDLFDHTEERMPEADVEAAFPTGGLRYPDSLLLVP